MSRTPPAMSAADGDADEDQEGQLQAHFQQVRQHLEEQLVGFGELELVLTDMFELVERCHRWGVSANVLAMLDQLLAASSDDEGQGECLTAAIDVDPQDEPGTCDDSTEADYMSPRAEVLACIGDYLALFRRPRLALVQHAAAVAACSHCVAAQMGHAKALMELSAGNVSRATMEAAFACVEALHETDTAVPERTGDASHHRRASQCFMLLEDALSMLTDRDAQVLAHNRLAHVVPASMPRLVTPAAAAVEALARRYLVPAPWFTPPLESVDVTEAALPEYVISLLQHSQAFCHPRLESVVAHWRVKLGEKLRGIMELGAPKFSSVLLGNSVALACHCHFVGYCIPHSEAELEEAALEIARVSSVGDKEPCVSLAAWLLSAMYEPPSHELPSALFEVMGICDRSVSVLMSRSVHAKIEQEAIAQQLETLGDPFDSFHIVETPCRGFYDEIAYPPWHEGAVESVGAIPVPVHEHFRRLVPWRRVSREAASNSCPLAPEAAACRILVAGCGSGHQLAVELRVFANCEVVALDCSSQTLAVAKRKLRSTLAATEFERIRFVVGDIMTLRSDADVFSGGFDLVICGGVLHHLEDPCRGLQVLAKMLKPAGVLQLSTYSRLSVQSWQTTIQTFLRRSTACSHLFQSVDADLRRSPTRAEVRALRREVLSLPRGDEVRDLLVHFREFFTYAGIMDLLFHPLETSFTLPELAAGPLRAAGLRAFCVHFPDVNADMLARHRFRATGGAAEDPHMVDLARWHALEEGDPNLFGRMHTLLLEREAGASQEQAPVRSITSDDDAPPAKMARLAG